MAFKIIWSPEAVRDLEDIAEYIGRDSEQYAAAQIGRIVDAIENLALFPRMGPRVWRVGKGEIRELIEGAYRIIYVIEGDGVHIAAVVHGARRLGKALKGRLPKPRH